VETRQDVIDILELLYRMPRPYILFIYALRVIPNTELAKQIVERGVDLDDISANYAVIPPRAACFSTSWPCGGRPVGCSTGCSATSSRVPSRRRCTPAWGRHCAASTSASGSSTTSGSWISP